MTILSKAETPLDLTLRIGVTGTRHLLPEQLPRIRQQIADFLSEIKREATNLGASWQAQGIYGDPPNLRLVSVSPLAEGSDRLLAQLALEQGHSLICPLPFARSDYENDFETHDSKHQFRSLLSQTEASVLELDGARGEAQDRSYEAVGRYVVFNCDILVAVWDGKPGRGFGGTADIIRFSIDQGPPVWWIHSNEESSPSWLVREQDFLSRANKGLDRESGLRSYLKRLLLPPAVTTSTTATWLDRALHLAHPKVPALLALYPTAPTELLGASRDSTSAVLEYWADHDRSARGIARQCERRRLLVSGMMVSALVVAAAAALVSLSTHSTLSTKFTATAFEIVSLLVIAVMMLGGYRQRWHGLSFDYARLANLCRQQRMLALFGWSLQGPSFGEKNDDPRVDGTDWVRWWFGVLQRAAPVLRGSFDCGRLERCRNEVIEHYVDPQLDHYEERVHRVQRTGKLLRSLALTVLSATAVLALINLLLTSIPAPGPFILSLASLQAAALIALIGIATARFLFDARTLNGQSRRNYMQIGIAKGRLYRVDLGNPLASQDLAYEISRTIDLQYQAGTDRQS